MARCYLQRHHTQEAASAQEVEEDILDDLSDLARHPALLHLAGVDAGEGGLPGLHPGLRDSVRPPGRHLQGLQHLTSQCYPLTLYLWPHLCLSPPELQGVHAGAEAGCGHDGLVLIFLKNLS